MTRFQSLILSAAFVFGNLYAQIAPNFEVATIKPSAPDQPGRFIRLGAPGRISVTNMTLKDLIQFAYADGIGTLPISGGPNWIDRDHFDIEASGDPSGGPNQIRAMMRGLLAERFALKVHTVQKEVDIYALVPAKSDKQLGKNITPWDGTCSASARLPPPPAPGGAPGPSVAVGQAKGPAEGQGKGKAAPDGGPGGFKPTEPDPSGRRPRCSAMFSPSGMQAVGLSLNGLADMFSTPALNLGRPVVNRTGIEGEYNIKLDFAVSFPGGPAAAAPDPLAPSIFTAVQEQLGLKLESARGMQDTLVIDSVSKPTDN